MAEVAPTLVDGPIDYEALAPRSRACVRLGVGRMADGSELAVPALVAAGTARRPRLVCVAGVHGNEYEGITALYELWDELDVEELRGTVVFVPIANPPAFQAGCRRNPHDAVDLNRVFPGRADGSVTERLAARLFEGAVDGADFVLSLHGWTSGALVVPYVEYPRDSPVTGPSRAAADAFGLDFVEAFDWPPGLLVAVCASRGIPAIEPEIGGLDCTVSERRALYKRGVRNLMAHLGLLAGPVEATEPPRRVTRSTLVAPTGGVLRRFVELGDQVSEGQPVALVSDLFGRPQAELAAPKAGFVAALRLAASVHPGDAAAVVFHVQDEGAG